MTRYDRPVRCPVLPLPFPGASSLPFSDRPRGMPTTLARPATGRAPRFRLRRWIATALALASFMLGGLGCGVGEYRSRLERRLGELATASEFAGLYAPQLLADKPVSVRVPQAFESQPLVAGVEIAEEAAAPADTRVHPVVIDLPGLTYTYEEFVADAEGGRIPFYLYLGAQDTTQSDFREPTTRWISQLRERFPGEELAWENVDCDTPEGRTVDWRRLRAEGEQDFYYVDKQGKGRVVKLPGVLEVYYRVEADWAVTIAWRVPAIISEHVSLDTWGPMVAGTVDVQ